MKKITVIYWKEDNFWLGKIEEHPEIMTQGHTKEELLDNIRDAYRMMIYEDVPEDHEVREMVV